jgi:DNA-binding NarL/FixJ family response regulator
MCNALIVEDNSSFRHSLHRVLARRFPFMRIAEAENGEEALRQAATNRPDLVFMDIRLPGRSGLDVTRTLKSINVNAAVCFITSYDLPEYRAAAQQSGADYFLLKGESTEAEIVAVVDSILSARVKTLIIEDNASFRDILDEVLTTQWPSMLVVGAADGPEGLEDAETFKPDVLLLDLRLPTANGIELARVIKARHPTSTIVIVTGHDLPEYRKAAARAGVAHFIAKTENVAEEIIAIVTKIVSGKEATRH